MLGLFAFVLRLAPTYSRAAKKPFKCRIRPAPRMLFISLRKKCVGEKARTPFAQSPLPLDWPER